MNEVITKRISPLHQIGLLLTFGIISILSSYAGVRVTGAIANIRDFIPMISGLTYGSFVGGWCGVNWRHSTILYGRTSSRFLRTGDHLFRGICRSYLSFFQREVCPYLFCRYFCAAMESFHMILILILTQPYAQAATIVQAIVVPMVFVATYGMLLYSVIITKMIERSESKIHDEIR